MIKRFFKWVFQEELKELKQTTENYKKSEKALHEFMSLCGIDVDINTFEKRYREESWACISIQGKAYDFIKFVNLGDRDIHTIHTFLKNFEHIGNIDAPISMNNYLRFDRRKR